MGLALVVCGSPASGQGHPIGLTHGRPLQERIGQADLVVLCEVLSLSPGRIQLRRLEVLHGEAPDVFTVKRSRSDPPPLVVGDRAILPLQGARPPYVLVDHSSETIRLAHAEAEQRWSQAVRGVVEHRGDPERLAGLMLGWVDAGPVALRDAALASLLPLLGAEPELRLTISLARADAAADPQHSAPARAVSALLAQLTPEGTARLIDLYAAGAPLEEVALARALRAATLLGHPGLARLFERGLSANDPRLRKVAAAEPGAAARLGDDAVARLRQVAEEDPDPEVRRVANESLGRLHRARRPADPEAR